MRNWVFAAPAIILTALALAGCGSSSSSGGTGILPGTLAVTSNPSGARVAIDGQDTGKVTPATVNLNAGTDLGSEFVVTLSLPGYNAWSGLATVTADESFTMQANLAAAGSAPGTLVAQSEPAGSRVYIDGVDSGSATPALVQDVPAGQHIVEYRLSGYHNYREEVALATGETVTSAPVLTRLGNGRIAGRVLDPEGNALVDATVTVVGTAVATRTTLYGIFVLPNVPEGTYTLSASLATGSTTLLGLRDGVRAVNGRVTGNADILTSADGAAGALAGRVLDSRGREVDGAVLFASPAVVPNFLPDSTLAPQTTETDSGGYYRFNSLPAGYWVVTAAYPGLATVTRGISPQIFVPAGGTAGADFTLPSANVARPAAPRSLTAVGYTMPQALTRAPSAYEGIRDRLLDQVAKARGLTRKATRAEATARSRTAPPGSLLEIDLLWDYPDAPDLIGYFIGRSTQSSSGFSLIEDLLNPHAELWVDYDQRLAPNRSYFYRVSSVNSQGLHSDPSNTAQARTLDQITVVSPVQTTNATLPTFRWNELPGAFSYNVWVFSTFPERYAQPLWESGWVLSPQTSVQFDGSALTRGQTYYWLVVGANSANPDNANGFSLGPVTAFEVE